MSFWKRRKQGSRQVPTPTDAGKVQKAKRAIKRSPPSAMEIKILALEALDSGLSAQEVGELVGGRYLNVASLEFSERITDRWRGAVFADTGRAYNHIDESFSSSVLYCL